MDCAEFLGGHSDYLDGVVSAARAGEFVRHQEACPSCARYHRVLVKGRELLQMLPPVEPPRDFYPRLQHRLYHVMDGPELDYGARASGTSTVAAVAIAVLMALAAWSPLVRPETPQVELPAIVVDEPSRYGLGQTLRLLPNPDDLHLAPSLLSEALWDRPNMLLYLYSPLGWRERQARSLRPVRVE